MLSRVAENIYWMARYVERAENMARIAEVNHHLTLDAVIEQKLQWQPLIAIFGDEENFFKRHTEASEANVVNFLACDPENPNSILSCLRWARENARAVRDAISSEAFLHLNMLYLEVREAASRGHAVASADLFQKVKLGAHLFFGLVNDTMSHDEGYRWAQIGRYIERADKTSRVIDVKYFILLPRLSDVGTSIDAIQWMALLKSVSAYQMYWRQMARIEPQHVVRFLLQDPSFPRSVRYCIDRAMTELRHVVENMPNAEERLPIEHFQNLCSALENASIERILSDGLHEFVDGLQVGLNELHAEINNTFFSFRPLPPSRPSRDLVSLEAFRGPTIAQKQAQS